MNNTLEPVRDQFTSELDMIVRGSLVAAFSRSLLLSMFPVCSARVVSIVIEDHDESLFVNERTFSKTAPPVSKCHPVQSRLSPFPSHVSLLNQLLIHLINPSHSSDCPRRVLTTRKCAPSILSVCGSFRGVARANLRAERSSHVCVCLLRTEKPELSVH